MAEVRKQVSLRSSTQTAGRLPASPFTRKFKRPSLLRQFVQRDRVVVVAVIVIVTIIATALAAPILPLSPPDQPHFSQRLIAPLQAGHLLGTDQLGRDLLSRLIWGARVSLLVGAFAALIASTGGAFLGLVAGFFGGRVDNGIMRLIDIMLAFPYVLLAIALVAALGPGLVNAMVAIAVVNISFFARNIRGNVIVLRNQGYIEAARVAGATTRHILAKHILPNVLAPLLVLISLDVGWMITETAGLSFLGLGAQPPQADWGSMLGDGRQYITIAYHVTLIPGIAILILVLSLNILGDSLRDLFDPRLRGR